MILITILLLISDYHHAHFFLQRYYTRLRDFSTEANSEEQPQHWGKISMSWRWEGKTMTSCGEAQIAPGIVSYSYLILSTQSFSTITRSVAWSLANTNTLAAGSFSNRLPGRASWSELWPICELFHQQISPNNPLICSYQLYQIFHLPPDSPPILCLLWYVIDSDTLFTIRLFTIY